MSIKFSKLVSPILGLQSKIITGKLAGCRVCDCIEDHHAYLSWASSSGYLKFSKEATDKIAEYSAKASAQVFYRDEIEPWESEDVPF